MNIIAGIVNSNIKIGDYKIINNSLFKNELLIGTASFTWYKYPRKTLRITSFKMSTANKNKGHYKAFIKDLINYSDKNNIMTTFHSVARVGTAKQSEHKILLSLGYKHNFGKTKIAEIQDSYYRYPSKTTQAIEGLYAAVTFTDLTTSQLLNITKSIPNGEKEFHSTLLYSRVSLPTYVPQGEIFPVWEAPSSLYSLEKWIDTDGKTILVLTYSCKNLEDRHSYLMNKHNATYDFDEYKPHITLSYDIPEEFNIDNINIEELEIQISNEYAEKLEL